ncbi:GNAT family N-acetyltransferase [Streptomyces sp. NPDC058092]|uniref:GNAT family N-acetyltransferase n=1 Tax=Streptomyces sp. NPDC058092 TaxID=3346336 RepID=UPI0036ED9E35
MTDTATRPLLRFRRAVESDVGELVRLRDEAARWQAGRGIDQWRPGELGPAHFLARLGDCETWLAASGVNGPVVGAWEVWWEDPAAWGEQPPVAGYVHRLVTDRTAAPAGTGRVMLAEAERRIASFGRDICRLDCLADNPRLRGYYEDAGYTVTGTRPAKDGDGGRTYGVTLLEKHLRTA